MDNASFEKRKKVINDLIHDKMYVPMKAKEIAILLGISKEDRPYWMHLYLKAKSVFRRRANTARLRIRQLSAHLRARRKVLDLLS